MFDIDVTDNRKLARYDYENTPIVVFNMDTAQHLGRIENLSTGGFLLNSDQPISIDTDFKISFSLPAKPGELAVIRCSVRSLWGDEIESLWADTKQTPDHYWTGFEFLDIPATGIEAIKRLNN